MNEFLADARLARYEWREGADPEAAAFLRRVDRELVPGPPEERWERTVLNILDGDVELLGDLTTEAAALPEAGDPTVYGVVDVDEGRITAVEVGEEVTAAFRAAREGNEDALVDDWVDDPEAFGEARGPAAEPAAETPDSRTSDR